MQRASTTETDIEVQHLYGDHSACAGREREREREWEGDRPTETEGEAYNSYK